MDTTIGCSDQKRPVHVRDHFKVATLDGFGLKRSDCSHWGSRAVLHYLTQHLRRGNGKSGATVLLSKDGFLDLDPTTFRHLEVLEPLHPDAPRTASLYGALNRDGDPNGRASAAWLAISTPIQHRTDSKTPDSGEDFCREALGWIIFVRI
jgi:DNA mismatch repair ATPase MutS